MSLKIVDWRGVRGLVAAKQLTDTADSITYDTPFPVCGLATLSKTTETSSATKFYDNAPAIVLTTAGGDEVAIDGSAIDDETLAKIFGDYYDEETGLYVEGEGEVNYWAIGYITKKTDGSEYYVWRLKGKFTRPEVEHATEDDGTDSAGNSLTFAGIMTQHKFAKTGKAAKAVHIPAAKYAAGEAAFFAEVQTPDTIGAT
jgi:phi13 family phage major tail protein